MTPDSQKRVLVADDDADVRKILTSALSQRGLAVTAVPGGKEAIDALREQRFSVVVLDLLMPGTDGFSVLDHVNRIDPKSLPVVLVLTGAEQSIVERLDPQRIHGIVRKPFDPQELAGVVLACAEIRSRGAFETMAIATLIAGSPLMAWLSR